MEKIFRIIAATETSEFRKKKEVSVFPFWKIQSHIIFINPKYFLYHATLYSLFESRSPALPLTIGEGAVAIVIAIASSIGHLEAALTNQIKVPHSWIRIATTMSPTTVSFIQSTHAILSTCRRITFVNYYRYIPDLQVQLLTPRNTTATAALGLRMGHIESQQSQEENALHAEFQFKLLQRKNSWSLYRYEIKNISEI